MINLSTTPRSHTSVLLTIIFLQVEYLLGLSNALDYYKRIEIMNASNVLIGEICFEEVSVN